MERIIKVDPTPIIIVSELSAVIKEKGFIIGYDLKGNVAASVTYDVDDGFSINTDSSCDEFKTIEQLLKEYAHLTFKYYD